VPPPAPPAARFFAYVPNGDKAYGPVDAATIKDWITGGRLRTTAQIRRENERVWLPLFERPEFAGFAPKPPPSVLPPPPLLIDYRKPLSQELLFPQAQMPAMVRWDSSRSPDASGATTVFQFEIPQTLVQSINQSECFKTIL
jgi:hypothetical protein